MPKTDFTNPSFIDILHLSVLECGLPPLNLESPRAKANTHS
jgi:hypothetical protein